MYQFRGKGIEKILLGFVPKNTADYECDRRIGDEVLFVQNGKTKLFEENRVMFPLLSHA
jgi:hypothetical protein